MLHPVRLRILQAFRGRSAMTARELAERLADVPQATLYRHLGALTDGGVLRVVEERRVRGAVERVFALPEEAAGAGYHACTVHLSDAEFAEFTAAMDELVARAAARPPTPERRPRLVARIVVPLDD